jgi:hypothetical protein
MKTFTLFAKPKSGKINFFFSEVNILFHTGIIVITIFLFSAKNLSAQNIKEYSALINTISNTRQSGSNESERLRSLVYDLKSKIYITNEESKTYGNGTPECVNIDANSIGLLYENNPLFSQVEIITITLNNPNELNFSLDLSKLQSFANIKYIQFLCSFECDPTLISKLYQETSKTGTIVFYRISIPE